MSHVPDEFLSKLNVLGYGFGLQQARRLGRLRVVGDEQAGALVEGHQEPVPGGRLALRDQIATDTVRSGGRSGTHDRADQAREHP